jgi:hypothetical protein
MSILKRANIFSMTPRQVQQIVEKTGQEASYIAGNKTEAIQALTNGIIDSTKGAVTTHSGARVGASVFKGAKDYARGDVLCTGLCATSGICETAAGIIIWIPIPGKICAVSTLKGISYGCMRIRDLCAAEPGNPLC